jgi:hypothetical protein
VQIINKYHGMKASPRDEYKKQYKADTANQLHVTMWEEYEPTLEEK